MKLKRNATIYLSAGMIFLLLFVAYSCGGRSGSSETSSITSNPGGSGTETARTGYVEGYIYAPETTAGKKGSVDPTPENYGPLATATIEIECGSVTKTGATDAEGYYKIEEVPVGDCTLTATKQGYGDIQRPVSVTENTGTTFTYTIDGRMLGKILLEDNTDNSGTTVSISYGENTEIVNANEKGFYVFPDLNNIEQDSVLIEASNSCEFYIPASSSFNIASIDIESNPISDITLQSLFKFTVETDKEVYHYGDFATATLTVEYRGYNNIQLDSSPPSPDSFILNLGNDELYIYPDSGLIEVTESYSLVENYKVYYTRMIIENEHIHKTTGYYNMFMKIGGERYIPGFDCAPKYNLSEKYTFLSPGSKYKVINKETE